MLWKDLSKKSLKLQDQVRQDWVTKRRLENATKSCGGFGLDERQTAKPERCTP